MPKIAKDVGDAKSYAERLFSFKEVGSLTECEAAAALIEPARENGVSYSQDAVKYIVNVTGGYPYFIQEFGKQIWKRIVIHTGMTISLDMAKASEPYFGWNLMKGFLRFVSTGQLKWSRNLCFRWLNAIGFHVMSQKLRK